MKKQTGITLIALIITIIVMLILVGVTINVALNGGLIEKAKTASEQTQKEEIKEQAEMAKASAYSEAIKNSAIFGVSEAVTAIAQELEGTSKGTYVKVTTKTGTYYVVVDNELKVTVTGTEPEVQPIVDNLIPTTEQKASAKFYEGDESKTYSYASEVITYEESNDKKTVTISTSDGVYLWACDEATATAFGSMLSIQNIQANKWYYGSETFVPYDGNCPVNKNDYTIEEMENEEYVDRVIASFKVTNN